MMAEFRIKEFLFRNTWISANNIYKYLRSAESNGLNKHKAIRRDDNDIVFINEDRFIQWVLNESKNLRRVYLHVMAKRKELEERKKQAS